MADQACQPTQLSIWNDIIPSPCLSPGQPIDMLLEARGLQIHSPDAVTNSSMSGSPPGSSTVPTISSTHTARRKETGVLHKITGTTSELRSRMKTACRNCRRRKVRCGRNEKVRLRGERGRSSLLTHDQCNLASESTTSTLQGKLDTAMMELFRRKEELKTMGEENNRLKKENHEYFLILQGASASVSTLFAHVAHAN